MKILSLIASRNFIAVNKDLMRLLGLNEAVLLGELASEYEYWREQDKLDGGWFYSTVENVEKNTTLKKNRQATALKNLQKIGIIEVTRKGLPAKRYIKINEEKILEVLSNKKLKNSTSEPEKLEKSTVPSIDKSWATSHPENGQLDIPKSAINKNNKIKINNNIKKESKVKREEVKKLIEGVNNSNSISENKAIIEKTKKPLTNNSLTAKKDSFNKLIESYTKNEKLQEELKEYLKARKAIKAPLTDRAIKLFLNRLDELTNDDEEKIRIVQNSIMNGWKSFYPLKSDQNEQLNNKSSYNLDEYVKTMDKFATNDEPPKWNGQTLGQWF